MFKSIFPITNRLLHWTVWSLLLTIVTQTQAAQTLQSSDGMVVAGHRLAALAGQKILQEDGNAMDAAIAVATTLTVAESWGSGLGGKLIMLYYDASHKQVYCVEALDQASQTMPQKRPSKRQPAMSIGVPGMLNGWAKAHEKWGSKPWAQLMQPAIDAAEQGFELDRFDIIAIKHASKKLIDGGGAKIFLPNQTIPTAGQSLTNPQLAKTYRLIQEQGYQALYGGTLGQQMVAHVKQEGGWMSMDDLKQYRSRIYAAPKIRYRDTTVYSSDGPATGGPTVLLTLACLNQQKVAANPYGAQRIDQLGRILLQVYGVVRNKLADHPAAGSKLRREMLPLAIRELNQKALQMDFAKTQSSAANAIDPSQREHSTTHFIVADRQGNVVCATQSLGMHFGCGVMVPDTGILMNTSLNNFSSSSDSPNAPKPGRRPRSTMSPTIILKSGQPILALGSPGGQRIPVSVLQVLTDVIDYDISLAKAIATPRFHIRNSSHKQLVDLEYTMDTKLVDQLQNIGWQAKQVTENLMYFGPVNGIQFDGPSITGVGDLRRTNTVTSPMISANP